MDDIIDGEIVQVTNPDERVALIKMENDTFFAAAKAMPRDHKAVRADMIAQFDAYPALAGECIYSKPVGKDKDTGEMKYATGLSVRCAEALADVYGYNRVEAETIDLDDERVKVVATFTDFARVRVWRTSGILSKRYKDRYGKMQRIADDRFYGIVVKAEASRLIREAITRSVPPGLRAEIRGMCERKMAGLLSENGVKKIADKFEELGVSVDALEKLLGKKSSKWAEPDRVRLGGIFNGIDQGETTVAEVFGGQGAGDGTKRPDVSIDELDNPQRVDEPEQPTETTAKPKRGKSADKPAPKADEKPADKADPSKPADGAPRASKALTKATIESEIRACQSDDQLNSNYKYFAKRIAPELMDWLNSICSEQSERIRGVDEANQE